MSVALFGSIVLLCASAAYGCSWRWQSELKDGAIAAIGILLLFVIAMWAWGRATVGYSGSVPLFLLYYVAIPIAGSAMLGITAGLAQAGRGEK